MADETRVVDEDSRASEPQKSSGRSKTWLWMLLSLVVVGGFLVWLGMASEPTQVAVAEGEEDATETVGVGESGATLVPKDTLAEDKAAYEGETIQVARVAAMTKLGDAIFWGELGTQARQVPILVRLDSTAAEGWTMQQGALYTITGEVRRMTDSVATAWGEQGEFTGEGEQMQATFTDYFIQASRIRPSRGPASDAENGDAGAAGNGG